jgi:multicomponent Na+:H+ antiporter subunit E
MQRVVLFIITFLFWLILTGFSLNPAELAVGGVVSLVSTLLFQDIFSLNIKTALNPRRIFLFFFGYIPAFIYYCVKANFDVAGRILHPALPIHPGIIKVKTNLTSPTARTWLANTLTLIPGTLPLDIIGDSLYLHWINVKTLDETRATEILVKKFDALIKEIAE